MEIEEFSQRFGKRIETLRNQKGMTRQQLADKSGESLEIIEQLEAGNIPGELVTIFTMARKLNIPLHEFFKTGFE